MNSHLEFPSNQNSFKAKKASPPNPPFIPSAISHLFHTKNTAPLSFFLFSFCYKRKLHWTKLDDTTRLHRHTIFGVVSVSDTKTGMTRWIPVSDECLFFFFLLLRRNVDTLAVKEKKNHRFWQIDLSIPLILWYNLKQKSKFRVWDLNPPSLWPLPAATAFCLSSELDWADRRAP